MTIKVMVCLEITNNDSKSFAATTRYASLSLGSNDDYFDVNNAISVARYAVMVNTVL